MTTREFLEDRLRIAEEFRDTTTIQDCQIALTLLDAVEARQKFAWEKNKCECSNCIIAAGGTIEATALSKCDSLIEGGE